MLIKSTIFFQIGNSVQNTYEKKKVMKQNGLLRQCSENESKLQNIIRTIATQEQLIKPDSLFHH